MKIFKITAIVLAAVVCLALIGNGIHLSRLGKTVDLIGVVDAVDTEKQTIKVTDADHVEYLLQIKFYTVLKNLENDKLKIEEIKVGDYLTANYRGEWESADHALTATYIKAIK